MKKFIFSFLIITCHFIASSQCNNYSLNFNGTSSYVTIPDNTNLRPDYVTVSVYFKTTSTNIQGLINKWKIADGSNLNYGLSLNHTYYSPLATYAATTAHGTNCSPSAGYSTIIFQNGTAPTNQWINLTFTYDGTTQKMYINGSLIKAVTTSMGPIGKCTGGQLLFGIVHNINPLYFSGKMDEIMVYNRALTQIEVQQRLNSILVPANENGLVAYYRFEDGSGTVATDLSGNGNNGTLVNCSFSSDVPFTTAINSKLNVTGNQNVCPNDSLQLKVTAKSNFKYSWYKNGIIIGNATNYNYYAKTVGNYFCLITDSVGGCQKYSDTITLNVGLPVQANFNGPFILDGTTFNATYTSSNGNGFTYNWTPTNGSIQSGQFTSSVSILWNSTGPYSLKLELDSNGCKGSKTVTVYPPSYYISKCNYSSLNFNGNNSYVSIPDNGTLRPDYVTISLYYKTTSVNLQSLINKWKISDGSSLNYGISLNHTAFSPVATFAATTDHGTNCATGMGYSILKYQNGFTPTNVWTSLVFTYDGIQQKIYVNGALVQTNTTNLGPIGKCTGGELAIGISYLASPFFFNGNIDEISIFNRPLSQTEIQQRLNTVLTPTNETGLVAYYRLEESTGTQVDDMSGNNNNGTLYNCTWSSDVPFTSGINAKLNLKGMQGVCINDSLLLNVQPRNNFKYAWYKDGVSITNATQNFYYAKPNGAYCCLISDTLGICQKYSDTATLFITQPVEPIIKGPFILTVGNYSGTYVSTNTFGVTYLWSLFNGTIQSGQGTNTVSVTWNTTGPYSIKLIIDSIGCKNSKTMNIFPSSYAQSRCNNYSLNFNGTNSYVSIPDDASLRTDYVTVSVYFKTTTTNMQGLLNKWKIADGSSLNYGISLNHTAFTPVASLSGTTSHGTNCAPAAGYTTTNYQNGTLPLNVWINVAFTYDGTVQNIYVNGILVKSIAASVGVIGKCIGGAVLMGIVHQLNPFYFSGNMDEISIYNRALSQTEIQQKLNTVLTPANEIGLIAYYRLEEGTGTQVDDLSGNNNNGTLYNCTWSTDVPFNAGMISKLSPTGSLSICINDSIMLQVTPRPNFKYQWYRNTSALTLANANFYYAATSGKYFCSITDTLGNCQKNSDTFSLTVNSLPALPIITGPLNLSGGIMTATYTSTNTSGMTHLWTITNGIIQSGQGTNSINVLWSNSGPYSLTLAITDVNGCNNKKTIVVTKGVGINNIQLLLPGIAIFPNPAFDVVVIKSSSSSIPDIKYSIADESGKQILAGKLNNGITEVDIRTLAPGFYFISIGNNDQKTFKFVKGSQ